MFEGNVFRQLPAERPTFRDIPLNLESVQHFTTLSLYHGCTILFLVLSESSETACRPRTSQIGILGTILALVLSKVNSKVTRVSKINLPTTPDRTKNSLDQDGFSAYSPYRHLAISLVSSIRYFLAYQAAILASLWVSSSPALL